MKMTIIMDGRFEWFEGAAHSSHMAYSPFVYRFLKVFDEIEICARAYDTAVPNGALVTGPHATFLRIGDYRGAWEFIEQLPGMARTLWHIAGAPHPVLAYLPGTLPIMFGFMRLLRRRPLFSIVVADPSDQLGTGALNHPLRRMVRCLFIRSLKFLLRHSSSAMYVTRFHLQRRYPLSPDAIGFATSDVYVPDEAYVEAPRTRGSFEHKHKTLVYVAMMAQGYKGHDDLVQALVEARRTIPSLRLVLIGDGPLRPRFEMLAEQAGVRDAVEFVGKLPHGAEMTARLDTADLFVMPSRAEGLPRALIEAMARGLPALSTDVGGVGELLQTACLVPPNDPVAFASRLVSILRDPDAMAAMSAVNLKTAREYQVKNTTERMVAFYLHIRTMADHVS